MFHCEKMILFNQNGLECNNCERKKWELTKMFNYKMAQQQNRGITKNLNYQTEKV